MASASSTPAAEEDDSNPEDRDCPVCEKDKCDEYLEAFCSKKCASLYFQGTNAPAFWYITGYDDWEQCESCHDNFKCFFTEVELLDDGESTSDNGYDDALHMCCMNCAVKKYPLRK
jgi:hypothetical protein